MSKVVHAKTCPTCSRGPSVPYRVTDKGTGKVLQGCVDHFHTGHLMTPSESAWWHYRADAKKIRTRSRAMRDGYVTEYTAD